MENEKDYSRYDAGTRTLLEKLDTQTPLQGWVTVGQEGMKGVGKLVGDSINETLDRVDAYLERVIKRGRNRITVTFSRISHIIEEKFPAKASTVEPRRQTIQDLVMKSSLPAYVNIPVRA